MSANDNRLDPYPAWAQDCAEDPNIDIDLDEISVLRSTDVEEPCELRTPCAKFNQSDCLSQATCPWPHVCSKCLSADHSATRCAVEPDRTRSRAGRGKTWGGDVSYTPCARFSLLAEPLPRPPPRSKLPVDLVRVVEGRPDLFKIVTPVDVDVLESLLSTHPNRRFVESVLISLREGFWPFAGIPTLLPNESRRQKCYYGTNPEREFLAKHIETEIKSERFSPSFGGRLLKGMACMPVQLARGRKFRLIYDHSAGEHSLNSLIPKSERSSEVDRIDALIRILRNRGLDPSQVTLFKSDIAHAFRILPMSIYWQALQAVKINERYYIDRCNTFGNAGSQRLFGAFYSLVLWIAENIWRLPDICCYVDDNFSWDFASRMRDYNGKRYVKRLPEKQVRLLELWDLIGIPHASKKQEYGSILSILGFRVDLQIMRVSISEHRRERILATISEFCATSAMSLRECQMLAGSINWIFEVNPLLRPGIDSLHQEMAKVGHSNDGTAPVAMTRRVVSDLQWLSSLLQGTKGVHFSSTVSWVPDQAHSVAYVHASPEGFGIWFPFSKQAFYHRYRSPITSSFLSDVHAFAVACAIDRSAKVWNRLGGLEGRPSRFAVLTQDKATVTIFGQLHARDELRDTLLSSVEMLVRGDMDIFVSQQGKKDDFEFVVRLSSESKDVLDTDYPGVFIRELIIPVELARRAGWRINSRKKSRKREFVSSEVISEKGRSGYFKSFLPETWGEGLVKRLTYSFR